MTATTRRIGFLGPFGTFTEQALRSQPDLACDELVPMRTFVDILMATQEGELDLGFVAIENAIEGTVNVTMDTLVFDTNLLIQREVILDIEMMLMAAPGTTIDDVTTIASHPVANAQCRGFLREHFADLPVEVASSTAQAAEMAATTPGLAAVGPAIAGQQYGLDTLAANIADHPDNQTRFLVVGRDTIPAPTGHDRTTIMITQREDKPGSLVTILQEFAARGINMSLLISRPAKTSLGNYHFIIDLHGHINDDLVASCLQAVRAKHADVKFLGSYPAATNGSSAVRQEAVEAFAEAAEWMADLRGRVEPSESDEARDAEPELAR
ncbi:MAG: prephenate dehydratase [Acidimicrobiales bacterium]